MKTVKIKFVDFYSGFDEKNNDFVEILKKRYRVAFSNNPDYLIYSGFGYEHLRYECLRIFYTGECITPNFNECDYAIGFDRLTFGDRYMRIPLYKLFEYRRRYAGLANRPHIAGDAVLRRGFCSFVVSNCFANDARARFFEALGKYREVASGGRYKNNIGGAVGDKLAFLAKYKFNIAFENCVYDGYATEKIVDAFAAGTVPIYLGDPHIANDFNPKAFINVGDYSNFSEAIRHIEQIDRDDVAYLDILNETPILSADSGTTDLSDFLYSIFDRPLDVAYRRPQSQSAHDAERMKLRHVFFETKVYKYYRKGLNQIARLRKGTMLTRKRNNR